MELSQEEGPLNEELKKREVDFQMCRTELAQLSSVLKNYENRLLEKERLLASSNPDVFQAYRLVQNL